jgi:FG-GAP-like repeat
MHRFRLAALLLAVGSTLVLAAGQGFHLVEESQRLGPDVSPPGTSSTDVNLVDIDGDGDLDLYLAEGTDSLAGRPDRLLINDGQANFTDESATRLPPPNNQNSTVADFGDVDGDGDLDALVAGVLGEDLLINDGAGAFTLANGQIPAPIVIPPQGKFDITAHVLLADVDGDGDLDALLSNENPFNPSPTGGDQNRLWINNGAGVFTDETAARLPARNDQTGAIVAGDIDDDGDLDLVVLDRGQDFVLINVDGLGHFVDQTTSRFPATSDTSRGGGLADLDGDGDLDLLVGNSRGEAVAYYRNNGAGVFTAASFGHVPGANETVAGIVLVDLDGDGDDDVYLPNAGAFQTGHGFVGGPDRYFRNNGQGKFQERTSKHFGTPPSDPTTAAGFGDLDGDGDLDLITAASGVGGEERLFVNRHNGCHD